jgi:glycosyltransferase involved in cell wall biosynthesis
VEGHLNVVGSNERPPPTLSVGLAVYNGEDYLREAIDSVLAQSFRDFELIISDNASTDTTPEICAEYAARDPRIRYSRNPKNIGGANNENLTFELSRGKYFRLAAHDDVCAPTLFERCIEVLDREPDVVLAFTRIVHIDAAGNEHGSHREGRGTEARPGRRFRGLADRHHQCEATYGVIRSDVLRQTPLQRNYTGSDRVLLCDLALRGRFVQLDEPLFFKRNHEKNVYFDWRERMAWYEPAREPGRIAFPNWIELYWLTHTALTVPERITTRLICVGWVLEWSARRSLSLGRDVYEGLRTLVGRGRSGIRLRRNWD